MAVATGMYLRSFSLAAALSTWVRVVHRLAAWVVVAALIGSAVAIRYAARHLGVNTDTAAMISEELPWRQDYLTFKETFPSLIDNLVLVVDGETPDLADDAVRRLAALLEKDDAAVLGVYVPDGGPFFDQHALLYLELDELAGLSDRLAGLQPFLSQLQRDPSLGGLWRLLGDAVEREPSDTAGVLGNFLQDLAMAIEAAMEERFFSLSWQALLAGEETGPIQARRIVIVLPNLDWSEWLPAARAIESARSAALELGLVPAQGVRVRVTGGAVLAHEELASVSRGMLWAAPAALILVGVVLAWGLRSWRLVLASLFTLLVGLLWTAAFAAWAVGELNLISIAFAILYIGLGVDYAIHYALRYRELVLAGRDNAEALADGAADVGRSLVLCAVTTGIGFYSFLITDFEGVSQLGLISGTGMFVSLLATLTVLPAVLALLPEKARGGQREWPRGRAGVATTTPSRRRRASVSVLAGVLGLASMVLLPWARFDRNELNLREAGTEGMEAYQDLLRDSARTPWTINVVLGGEGEAESMVAKLQRLDSVHHVVRVHDFVPDSQPEKLARIDELALMLGPLRPVEPRPTLPATAMAELRRLLPKLESYSSTAVDPRDRLAAARLVTLLGALMERLQTGQGAARRLLDRLDVSVLGGLSPALANLARGLEADTVSLPDLPSDLVPRWVAPDGRYRLEVFPNERSSDVTDLRRFVSQVHEVAPTATDSPVVVLNSGDVVARAFQQAFACAFVLISVVLWFALRRWQDVMLVLAPLVWASLLTVASMVVLDIPFNYANVIALPLLLGMGVDSAIHVVARLRGGAGSRDRILSTSTGRAVLVSGLTTFCGLGNLALSPHPGTASMGQVLTVGLLWILVSTLVLLPAVAGSHGHRASPGRSLPLAGP